MSNHIADANKMVSDTPMVDAMMKFCFGTDEEFVRIKDAAKLERELNAGNQRIKRLEDCAETAWGIIANVDSGSWQEQRADWREAATRWRDEQFHPELSEHKAKEAKP